MSANPLRGEAELVLDGRSVRLRPTFGRLVAAEAELGPLFALVDRAAEGRLGLAELAGLLWHCLDEEARPDRDAFGEALLAGGLAAALAPARAVLAQALKGR
ncbi:MAG: GTA-gp10 family protein [Sphingomonadaceae bacterium]